MPVPTGGQDEELDNGAIGLKGGDSRGFLYKIVTAFLREPEV